VTQPTAEVAPETPVEPPAPRKRPKVLDALKAAPPPSEEPPMQSEDLF